MSRRSGTEGVYINDPYRIAIYKAKLEILLLSQFPEYSS